MIRNSLSVNEVSTPTKKKNKCIDRQSESTMASSSSSRKVEEDDENSPIKPFHLLSDIETNDRPSKGATDRFIPLRTSSKLCSVFSRLHEEQGPSERDNRGKREDSSSELLNNVYTNYLRSEVLGIISNCPSPSTHFCNSNFFSFSSTVPSMRSENQLARFDLKKVVSYTEEVLSRKIPKIPFKILDAPALQDDFYLNLLDWSSSNLLAVGLGSSVYLWRASNGVVLKVCDMGPDNLVTSVSWDKRDSLLAVGTSQGFIDVWDVNKLKKIRNMEGHSARVGALAWGETNMVSGSRDKTILIRDVRSPAQFHEKLEMHKQEVCGLKWSFDDQMFCSGGNDNKLFVWTPKSRHPVFKSNAHKAAVKALAWSPHQHGLLASGGGTVDRCIRFWNTQTGRMVSSLDTGAQVCNLMFSKTANELVSTHGYTENQVHLWSYPKMEKQATLTGHTMRVLYLAMSPDGRSIVTGAGDETLRFWDIYPKSEEQNSPRVELSDSLSKLSIR